MAKYKLAVEVVDARGLMPTHRQGSGSACVGLNFDGQWFCTAVKEKDGNPVWNERFYFDVSDPLNLPKLALEVYVHHVNKSAQGVARSFIGRVRIYGSAIPPHSNDVALQYYQLEKRSLLQRINGELGLKVYIIPALLLQEDRSPRPHDMPLQHLKEITNNFSNERILGQGGFGVVYKGILQNGETIAVKKITSSLMPGLQRQFESEVAHLMMLKHPNIVRCVGYCYETRNACLEYNGKYVFAETTERLICLECMPKGSLDKYLSDESSGLDWSTRYNITEGICYGLCHLHEENDKPIIHMDLKPPNILLGDGMLPKITDFGLSRLLDQKQTICTSSRNGTLGYMAPEFLHGGTMTPKSDIFSLGVVIMEVVTGHRDYPDVTRTPSADFIELIIKKWRNVLQRTPGYISLEADCKQIKRCIQVGLICVNPDRTKRPPIMKVIGMLQGSVDIDCDIGNEDLGKWKIRLVRSQSKRPPVRNIINMLRGFESIDCDISNHATSSVGKCGEPLHRPL